MRTENKIYFAPGIEFRDLDWGDSISLLHAFNKRVYGFYIEPASRFRYLMGYEEGRPEILPGLAFGCGVICSTAIDFLAGIELYPNQRVGERYEKWMVGRIREFSNLDPDDQRQTLARRFYKEFRNGLVHEGRIKNAGQFSFDNDLFTNNHVVSVIDNAMVVHPFELIRHIEDALNEFSSELERNTLLLHKFRRALISYFSADMEHVGKQNRVLKSKYK